MKKMGLLIGLIVCSISWFACGTNATYTQIPRCEKIPATKVTTLVRQVYQPIGAGTCVAYIQAFDQAGWYESRLNSRRLRGEAVLRLGCTHCPPGNIDCGSPGYTGGCHSASFNFDFALIQEDAEIVAAYLAVYVVENADSMMHTVLKARANIGGDFTVLAGQPKLSGQWVLYDLTAYACRMVAERRNAVNLNLSLPCGPYPMAKVATAVMSEGAQATLIVEYR